MFSGAELMRQQGCSGQETERDTSVASFSLLDDGGGRENSAAGRKERGQQEGVG